MATVEEDDDKSDAGHRAHGVCEPWRRGVEIESVCVEFGWRSEEDKQRRWTIKRFFELEFGSEILSYLLGCEDGFYQRIFGSVMFGGGCGSDEEDDGGGGGWK